jgi:hypothetical protein
LFVVLRKVTPGFEVSRATVAPVIV